MMITTDKLKTANSLLSKYNNLTSHWLRMYRLYTMLSLACNTEARQSYRDNIKEEMALLKEKYNVDYERII